MRPKTDATLLKHWQQRRDAKAFGALVDRHAGMVYGASLRILGDRTQAEDVTQDCFLKLSQLGDFAGTSFAGWLHRVATNRARDVRKERARRATREADFAQSQPGAHPPEAQAILRELDDALAGLPDEVREPLILRYLEDRTYKEAARQLGVSRSTVIRRVQRGLDALRERLADHGVVTSAAVLSTVLTAGRVDAAPSVLVTSLRKLALSGAARSVHPSPASATGLPLPLTVAGTIVVLSLVLAIALPRLRHADGSESTPSTAVARTPLLPADTTPPPDPDIALAQAATTSDATPSEPANTDTSPASPDPEPETIVLTCVDIDGNPVSGAEVYAFHYSYSMPYMQPPVRPDQVSRTPFGPIYADDAGRIEIPRPTDISIVGAGVMAYARVPGELVGAWDSGAMLQKRPNWDRIVLGPSREVDGRVLLPERYPVDKVTITLLALRVNDRVSPYGASFAVSDKLIPPLWPELFTTRPDATGSFRLFDLPKDGAFYLAAYAPGLGEKQFYSLAPREVGEILLEMKPEAVIHGSVRYENGAPAPSVPVLARPRGANDEIGISSPFVTSTKPDGTFQLNGLPRENFAVMTLPSDPDSPYVASVVANVLTSPGGVAGPIDLVLESGTLVDAHIVDADTKEPVAGSRIVVQSPALVSNGQAIGSAKSDAQGFVRFRLPAGESMLYFAQVPPGYVYPKDQGRRIVSVQAGQRSRTLDDFILSRNPDANSTLQFAHVQGQVVDSRGEPLEGVPVDDNHVYREGEDSRQYRVPLGWTDENGRYSAMVDTRGTHTLHFGGSGFSRVEGETLTLSPGQRLTVPPVNVERFALSVTGRVTAQDGTPLIDASIRLYSRTSGERNARTGIDGAFRVDNLPAVPLKMTVTMHGFNDLTQDIEPGFDYDIALQPDANTPAPAGP